MKNVIKILIETALNLKITPDNIAIFTIFILLIHDNRRSMRVNSVSVNLHEPCLVGSVGRVLLVSSTSLAPANPPHLLQGSPGSVQCLTVSISCWMAGSALKTIGLGTNL